MANSQGGNISLDCVSSGSLSGDIDGLSDIEDVGSWDILSNSGLVVDSLIAWLSSGLGDGLFHNLFFLFGAINFDGDEIVTEDDLWNLNSDGSLGNDWGDKGSGTKDTSVESSEASSSVVATKSTESTESTNEDGTMIRVRWG